MQPERMEKLFADLAAEGWASQTDLIPAHLWQELQTELNQRQQAGQLQKARFGAPHSLKQESQIRGDSIAWLESADSSPAVQQILAFLETFRRELNRHLFLGLRRCETHFAHYPPETGYDLHLDRQREPNHRLISFVLYLNSNWRQEDGGHLQLHLSGSREPRIISLLPEGGRLVLFRSEDIPHQVCPARRARQSLTGWFRDDEAL